MTTRKGAGVNALGGTNGIYNQMVLDTLDYADSFHTTWADYCWDPAKIPDWPTDPQVGPDWVFCLEYQIPNATHVAAMYDNNPYHRNGWWSCGVEPDTAGEGNANPDTGLAWTAEEFADLITAQINVVKDVAAAKSREAKFWIRCGTQGGVNTTYMKDILSHISSAKRNNYIKAVGYHFYPQNTAPWTYAAEQAKLERPILLTWLENMLAKRDECNALYGLDLQFFLGEAGLTINTDPQSIYKENNALMQYWPNHLHKACEAQNVDRYFLYGWQDIPNYMNVYHGSTRTAYGNALDNAEGV